MKRRNLFFLILIGVIISLSFSGCDDTDDGLSDSSGDDWSDFKTVTGVFNSSTSNYRYVFMNAGSTAVEINVEYGIPSVFRIDSGMQQPIVIGMGTLKFKHKPSSALYSVTQGSGGVSIIF